MHFDILVEDASGKKALESLVPKLLGRDDSFRIHSYKGIGRIPKDLKKNRTDPAKRILLDNLPRLLKGYGKVYATYPDGVQAMVVVVCDLDDRNEAVFRRELLHVLEACHPKPEARFCLAIEEGEAWMLGDIEAIIKAYPNAKKPVLRSYVNDSICGTWELLADALYPGGAVKLSQAGWQAVGYEKYKWAENIAPLMDVETNKSPSFNRFVKVIAKENP